MGASFNSRYMYDYLNQVNFIGILAETFYIFSPNEETLKLHLDPLANYSLIELYKKMHENIEIQVLKELLENKKADENNQLAEHITRLDSMKINSMEIIISFQ